MEQFSLISLNLWNTEHWQERERCVISFLQTFDADIYCFQEVRPQTLSVLDVSLTEHQRVEGEEAGWRKESSIYIKREMFSIQDLGRIDLDMPEQDRGLFWAELETKGGESLIVATMHLTHQLNADEMATGKNYRHHEAHKAAEALKHLGSGKPMVICGDFNDPIHPSRIFHEQAGFQDVFTLLGLPAPITFPCPFLTHETFLVEAIDKIMIQGAIQPVLASSPHFMIPGQVLSDHWPVAAVLKLLPSV